MRFLKYTTSAYLSRIIILSVDILFSFLAIHIGSILRHNFDIEKSFFIFSPIVLAVLAVRIVSFRWFKTYAVIVRYAGVTDILKIFYAVTGGSLLLLGASILLRPYGILIPISVLLIEYFLLLTFMAAFRMMMPSLYYLLFDRKVDFTNVIIIGAGQLGASTLDILRKDKKVRYNVIGILDDNPDLQNKSLDGTPIYQESEFEKLITKGTVDKAIFAIQNISSHRKNEIVDLCLAHDIKVLQVPIQKAWLTTDFQVQQLKEVQIEDLLNRPVIALEPELLRREYEGKVILITGGAGSIGSEIIRQLIKYAPGEIIIVDQAESPLVELVLECKEEFKCDHIMGIVADVTDYNRMQHIFNEYRPNIVFHAAAYKHVPIMEQHPQEAVSVNVGGTKLVALLADKYNVSKFVMVSTDKAVNPTNVMGATKRVAEIFIQTFSAISTTKFVTTRFGNVLGSNGSVVPRFKKQIAKGGPITVTDKNITRYFMTIPEASHLVLEAGAMGAGGEIFLFDMGAPVRIAELAEKMIKLSGLEPYNEIDIIFTGLRPGEKLYEELLSTNENSLETHHPKITKARVRSYDFDVIEKSISELVDMTSTTDSMKLVKKIKDIVPEFKSNNSIFKLLDKTKLPENEVVQSNFINE